MLVISFKANTLIADYKASPSWARIIILFNIIFMFMVIIGIIMITITISLL